MALGEYLATHRTVVSSTASVNLLAKNPSDSGYELQIQCLASGASGISEVDVYRDVTVDSSGTSITPRNRLINDGANSSGMDIQHDATWSGGTAIYQGYVYSNETKTVAGTLETEDPDTFIWTGHNLLVEITNKSGSDSNTMIILTYMETSI